MKLRLFINHHCCRKTRMIIYETFVNEPYIANFTLTCSNGCEHGLGQVSHNIKPGLLSGTFVFSFECPACCLYSDIYDNDALNLPNLFGMSRQGVWKMNLPEIFNCGHCKKRFSLKDVLESGVGS